MSYEIKERYIFDPVPLAHELEMMLSGYLKPLIYQEGIYAEFSREPLLLPGNIYYCKRWDKFGSVIETRIDSIDDINGSVYNINDELIIPDINKNQLSIKPLYPVLGVKIIEAYIDNVIVDESAWSRLPSVSANEILKEFLLPKYRDNNRLGTLLDNLMLTCINSIHDFIGSNKWIMHFRVSPESDIIIEKSIDFRIDAWMREHADELAVSKIG